MVSEKVIDCVYTAIEEEPGITLLDLIKHLNSVTADDIYTMIARKCIYVDLAAAPLAEHMYIHCFQDKHQAVSLTVLY